MVTRRIVSVPAFGVEDRQPASGLRAMHTDSGSVRRARAKRDRGPTPEGHGLPTKVVTLWASSVALKRALLTAMGLLAARLSVAEVTHGVMLHGTTPET